MLLIIFSNTSNSNGRISQKNETMSNDWIMKKYDVHTSKSAKEIISDIKYRGKRQQQKKLIGVIEPIKYNNIEVRDDLIEIERSLFIYSPLQGIGKITFELISEKNGTDIKCTINPTIIYTWVSFGTIVLFLMYITISVVVPSDHLNRGSLLFLLILWVVCIGGTYLGFLFNRFNLESYSKTLLYDLGLIIPDK
jgi:hypothetical protein